jgi:hypothetical protein
MESAFFWDVTSCNSVKIHSPFEGKYYRKLEVETSLEGRRRDSPDEGDRTLRQSFGLCDDTLQKVTRFVITAVRASNRTDSSTGPETRFHINMGSTVADEA